MTPPNRAGDAGGEARPAGPSLQLTSFVGQERELGEIEDQLGRSRLLTLTGPGGCGKTRLALALGDRVAGSFADGVRWTWLAPVSDPGPVPEAVAGAGGLPETPGRGASGIHGDASAGEGGATNNQGGTAMEDRGNRNSR